MGASHEGAARKPILVYLADGWMFSAMSTGISNPTTGEKTLVSQDGTRRECVWPGSPNKI